jgi:acyl CoA:acetate/3-ketoacid CoA transferase alpha subunit
MQLTTVDQVLQLLQIVAIAASAVLNVYLYNRTRNSTQMREHRKQMKKLEDERRAGDAALHKRVDTISGDHLGLASVLDRRVSVLETTVKHMPTHTDLTGIRAELANLNGNVAALGERSQSNNEMLHSIQRHLMRQES